MTKRRLKREAGRQHGWWWWRKQRGHEGSQEQGERTGEARGGHRAPGTARLQEMGLRFDFTCIDTWNGGGGNLIYVTLALVLQLVWQQALGNGTREVSRKPTND